MKLCKLQLTFPILSQTKCHTAVRAYSKIYPALNLKLNVPTD